MKENVITAGKWIVAGALLLAVGFFVVTGVGRKRGTRAYRTRIALWTILLGLVGGGGALMVSSCDPPASCYKPVMNDTGGDVEAADKKSIDYGQPTCYAPRIDPDYSAPQLDVKPEAGFPLEDATVTCYLPRIEPDYVAPEPDANDVSEPDYGQPMCYAPRLDPDIEPQKETKEEPEVFIQCYDGLPPDVK